MLPHHVLNLQPGPAGQAHYRAAPAYSFHPYEHGHEHEHDDDEAMAMAIAPPALSAKRASRLSAPFPTFLYASEPPPVTARNKQRVRPSAAQLAELKALYALTAHPARDAREALGRRIGMRYQSVTNWFQNQRSTAKKRAPSRSRSMTRTATPHPYDSDDHSEHEHGSRPPSPPRPRPRTDPVRDIIVAQAAARQHLTLPLSGAAILPSDTPTPASTPPPPPLNITLPPPPRTTAATPPLLSSFQVSRAPSPSASDDVLGGDGADQVPRGKRSRPTPHQLAVLRALHARTSSPSIEERTRVGREIGMELGKVTNWFRNLRQTARKKERRALEAEGRALPGSASGKRTRSGEDGVRLAKRTRRSLDDDDDDDDAMSHSNSNSNSYSHAGSTAGSVDMEMEHEVDAEDVYYERVYRGQGAARFGERQRYDHHHDAHAHAHPSDRYDPHPYAAAPHTHPSDPHYSPHPHAHPHDPDPETRSEQGTESDAAHEAVTPPPPLPSPEPKHASVDDALLLLAFHGARA